MVEGRKQKELALVLLIKAIFDQLDEISNLQARGCSASISIQLLHEMGGVVRELPETDLALYHELFVKLACGGKRQPRVNVSEEYASSVAAAKRRLINKLRDDLALEAA